MLPTLQRMSLVIAVLTAPGVLAQPADDTPRLSTRDTRGELLEELQQQPERPSLVRPILMVTLAPLGAGTAFAVLGYSIPAFLNVSAQRRTNVVSSFMVGVAQVWLGMVTAVAVVVGAGLLAVAVLGVVKLVRRSQPERSAVRNDGLRRELDEYREARGEPQSLRLVGPAPRTPPAPAMMVPVMAF